MIFHVGSHQGAGFEKGLKRVVPALQKCLERCTDDTWLLIENTAGTGDTIGRSIEELAALVDRLDRHPRIGICLDSCHLYASGYDVTDRNELDRVLQDVDAKIGLDRLRALHVNDSKTPLGSNRDRHDNIGEGLMGDKLGVFLSHPKLQGLPALLEVPGTDGHGPGQATAAEAEAPAREVDEEVTALAALIAGALLAVPAKAPVPHFVKKVDVGGYKLAIECYGSGIAGDRPRQRLLDAAERLVLGRPEAAANDARLLVRPGRARRRARTGRRRSSRRPSRSWRELRTLLQQAKLAPPYVLGGWSIGGFDVRYYQHRYPDEVAGLVLVDGTIPSVPPRPPPTRSIPGSRPCTRTTPQRS